MKWLSRISSVVSPAMMRGEASYGERYTDAFLGGDPLPEPWFSTLTAAGITVTPELAMTLSAMYSGVSTIAMDLSTLPCQIFRLLDDGGKDRVKPIFGAGIDSNNGIGSLAYMLRWQPNAYQTATEFMLGMIPQLLLREVAYAEQVVSNTGPLAGTVTAILPRHPDRVRSVRLPSGRLRYQLADANGQSRFVEQDNMFVVRGMTGPDALKPLARIQYGAQAMGTALAAQEAAGKFFKSGMTAALLATYSGEMGEDEEKALHGSISRYAAGVDNAFGLMLVPDDVKVSNLAIAPEKAQMMEQQEWGVREVARLLRLPGHKLGIKDSVAYASQVQAALDYVISCLRPIAILFEQAIKRDLILIKDKYTAEFKLEGLLRGDFEAQANYLEKFCRNRIMRPSEARLILNMNPDEELDGLWAKDHQPGQASGSSSTPPAPSRTASGFDRTSMRSLLVIYDNAVRCVRRERVAIERLARKHAEDVEGWQSGLRDFYADHARFVAQVMRISMEAARAYAAQHGSVFVAQGIVSLEGEAGQEWERAEAEELAALSLAADDLTARGVTAA